MREIKCDGSQQSVREAVHIVLDELRSHRDPEAVMITLNCVDLEDVITALSVVEVLMEVDSADSPF